MKGLLDNDMFWLVAALLALLVVVVILSLGGKPVDERLIGGGVLVLVGAIATHARHRP